MRKMRFCLLFLLFAVSIKSICQEVCVKSEMGVTYAGVDLTCDNNVSLGLAFSPEAVPHSDLSFLSMVIEDPELKNFSQREIDYIKINFGDEDNYIFFYGDLKDQSPELSNRNDTKQYNWYGNTTLQLSFMYWLGSYYVGKKNYRLATNSNSKLNSIAKKLFCSQKDTRIDVFFKRSFDAGSDKYSLQLCGKIMSVIPDLYKALDK